MKDFDSMERSSVFLGDPAIKGKYSRIDKGGISEAELFDVSFQQFILCKDGIIVDMKVPYDSEYLEFKLLIGKHLFACYEDELSARFRVCETEISLLFDFLKKANRSSSIDLVVELSVGGEFADAMYFIKGDYPAQTAFRPNQAEEEGKPVLSQQEADEARKLLLSPSSEGKRRILEKLSEMLFILSAGAMKDVLELLEIGLYDSDPAIAVLAMGFLNWSPANARILKSFYEKRGRGIEGPVLLRLVETAKAHLAIANEYFALYESLYRAFSELEVRKICRSKNLIVKPEQLTAILLQSFSSLCRWTKEDFLILTRMLEDILENMAEDDPFGIKVNCLEILEMHPLPSYLK